MSLTNAQYQTMAYKYEEIRNQNRHLLNARKEEIFQAIPEYRVIEQRISTLCIAQGKKMLCGDNNALTEMKQELHQLSSQKKQLLISNGYSGNYLEPIYSCADCQDTGYLPDHSKCHCMKQRIVSSLYKQSGIEKLLDTENFSKLSFQYYTGDDLVRFEKAVLCAKNFIKNFSSDYQNLLFYGTVGTGKSFLSYCIAKELLDQGYCVMYFSACTLFDKISEYTFDYRNKELLSQFYQDLYDCDLLIIDDLGTELVNSFISSELFTCLNERHLRKRATIISSNISLEDLSRHYSERLFSRVTSNFELLKFTGQDIRMFKKRIANRK